VQKRLQKQTICFTPASSTFSPKPDRITASLGFSAYQKGRKRAGALATGTLVHRRTGALAHKNAFIIAWKKNMLQ